MSRQPALNGRTSTLDSGDVSPNLTQKRLEADSNSSMRLAGNSSPFQLAKMNVVFAGNEVRRLDSAMGHAMKKTTLNLQNASHMFAERVDEEQDPWGQDWQPGKARKVKKFTCLPKLITPIACEEVEEEEKKGVD